jgi:hypothetical protein
LASSYQVTIGTRNVKLDLIDPVQVIGVSELPIL